MCNLINLINIYFLIGKCKLIFYYLLYDVIQFYLSLLESNLILLLLSS